MSADVWTGIVTFLVAAALVLALIGWHGRRHRRTTEPPDRRPRRDLGCLDPDEPVLQSAGYVTGASAWLADQLLALEPGTQWGGTYAAKPGYHNTRNANSPQNYSVVDRPPDDGGPGDKAAAYDWTFPEAQSGDYTRIAKYTSRLLASAQDWGDPRLNGWREFYGQADADSYVEGWDCRYGYACTSDSSHLWHLHLSENRDQTESYDNKKALLSVLKGETVAQWRQGFAKPVTRGDGAVLLYSPIDPDRLDLFWVGPDNEVWHRWCFNGIDELWGGRGSAENLGGRIVVGTLTAAWIPDGTGICIAGLGLPDVPGPAGCGQYWAYRAGVDGSKSGWGSCDGIYGRYPAGVTQKSSPN
jgi:hypothetical protein